MKDKATKQREAAARQAAHDTLTPAQKMAKLNAGDHRAKRERTRLLAAAEAAERAGKAGGK